MNSSFYSRLDFQLRALLESLDTVAGLHIDSIEFTVLREKGQFNGLVVEILYLPRGNTEQLIKGKDEKKLVERQAGTPLLDKELRRREVARKERNNPV